MNAATPRVAVILSGCGVMDGSEIHESVSVLIHLSRLGAAWHCFAPDQEQAQVVDHYTGEVEDRRQRNMLHEAARIARGKAHISALGALDVSRYDALIFPGGFGAAKNLCTFAVDGADCDVLPEVERAVRAFHGAGKPIGMCCIAPVIAARILGRPAGEGAVPPRITMGPEGDAPTAARAMGATHVAAPVLEAVLDEQNRIVTTPAYMCDAPVHEVFAGIGRMVEATIRLANDPARARAGGR